MQPSTAQTPHGRALVDRVAAANAAIHALLAIGCLIEHLEITADEVRVQLVRCPMPGALERHAVHQWWYQLPAPGEAMRGVIWHGVRVEWPIHSADIPNREVA